MAFATLCSLLILALVPASSGLEPCLAPGLNPQGSCTRRLYFIGNDTLLANDLSELAAPFYDEYGLAAVLAQAAPPPDSVVGSFDIDVFYLKDASPAFNDPTFVGARCADNSQPPCYNGRAFSLPPDQECAKRGKLGEDGNWQVARLTRFVSYACLQQKGCLPNHCLQSAVDIAFGFEPGDPACADVCSKGRDAASFQPQACVSCVSQDKEGDEHLWIESGGHWQCGSVMSDPGTRYIWYTAAQCTCASASGSSAAAVEAVA
eukprot:5591891-Prymnesium_polylepis.2